MFSCVLHENLKLLFSVIFCSATNCILYTCVYPMLSTGGVREAAPGEDKQDVINEAGKQEIPLTLVNKFEGLAQDDSSDMRALFVRYVHAQVCMCIDIIYTAILRWVYCTYGTTASHSYTNLDHTILKGRNEVQWTGLCAVFNTIILYNLLVSYAIGLLVAVSFAIGWF